MLYRVYADLSIALPVVQAVQAMSGKSVVQMVQDGHSISTLIRTISSLYRACVELTYYSQCN